MRRLTHAQLTARRDAATPGTRAPVIVLLDNVRSLYNVGSIFRTCDAANIGTLILTGYTPHPPRKEISKTALGAEESVPWEYVEDPLVAVKKLKDDGVTICVVEQTDGSIDYTALARLPRPICLVVGNELTGVRDELIQLCDHAIEIPMHGIKHSLNVAVACGIVVYEAVKRA